MTREGSPEEPGPVARRPARSPRTTPELIVELQRQAAGLAMRNMGVAYLVGLLLAITCERKWVTL